MDGEKRGSQGKLHVATGPAAGVEAALAHPREDRGSARLFAQTRRLWCRWMLGVLARALITSSPESVVTAAWAVPCISVG